MQAECSDCTADSLDGGAKCFPGAPGYVGNSAEEESKAGEAKADASAAAEDAVKDAKRCDGVEILPFSELETDTRVCVHRISASVRFIHRCMTIARFFLQMKVVVFHWGAADKGVERIKVMQELAQDPTFQAYGWFHVDASVDEAAAKEFSEANLPVVFTQTPEDGIEKFVGDFTAPNFGAFHAFREATVDTDNIKTCDSPACIVKLAQEKPVFLKM